MNSSEPASERLQVLVVGGGMITEDLLLPSLYHLKRLGLVGQIAICALSSLPLKRLAKNPELGAAFPGAEFTPCPDLSEPEEKTFPDLYRKVLSGMPKHQAVVVAVPDHLHRDIVEEAIAHDQHVLCVKPLVQKYSHALAIERRARERGLFVGVEYHKRFDRRALLARGGYRAGRFGSFALGEARLMEPYYYRRSNFQNWFTTDATDPFVYVGCHYVDLVHFITGLRPIEVSVQGVRGHFPNGNEGFLWSLGRVRWENGALLSIANGLGYPDMAAGSNDQGLTMYCEGEGCSGMIRHDDQNRGVSHSYLEGIGPGGSHYNYVSPDFFRLVPWAGEGLAPVGYGYDSVAASIEAILGLAREPLEARKRIIAEIDAAGIIATPANSSINELVVEAGRMSILRDGTPVRIAYGESPHVEERREKK